jgi:outer membrane protein assembly factor BamA
MTMMTRKLGCITAFALAFTSACAHATPPSVRVVTANAEEPMEKDPPGAVNECAKKSASVENKTATLDDMMGVPVVARCVSGNFRLSSSTIRGSLATRVGDRFDTALTKRDIDNLYALGTLDDVQVLAALSDAGVELKYLVRERSWVGKITVDGAPFSSIPDVELHDMIKIGKWLDPVRVRESTDALAAALGAHGHPNQQVTFEIEHAPHNQALVTFKVTP